MSAQELAEMLNRARELGYDADALNFLTGWIESKLTRSDASFDANEFRFRSGFEKARKT